MFSRLFRFFFGSLIASVGAGLAFLLMREIIEEMERAQPQPAPADVGTNGTAPRPKSTGARRVQIEVEDHTDEVPEAVSTDPADKGKALGTRAAGEMLGLSPTEVRALIDEGVLPAFKDGRVWQIWESDVRAYKAGDN